jgi:hypothetical protein
MRSKRLFATVAALCAAGALTAGIAQGSGGKATPASTTASSGAGTQPAHSGGPPGGMTGGPGDHAVHSVLVVLDKAGTAYITQTIDSGTLQSIDSSADTITLVEGTKSVTYKTVTVNVPSEATVTLDGKASSFSALTADDRVSVSSSSDGMTVSATDSSFHPQGGPGHAGSGGPPPAGEGSSASSSSG